MTTKALVLVFAIIALADAALKVADTADQVAVEVIQ